MLGVSFIAGAYNATLRSNAKAKPSFSHLGTMAKPLSEDPQFRARVEAIDAEIERQLAEGEPSKLACPDCQRPMQQVVVEGIELDACASCKGFWFDHGELTHFTSVAGDVANPRLKDRASRFRCPHCEEVMRETVFKAPFNLLLDRCPNGHGVFCEAKEFQWAMGLGHNQPIDSGRP